MRLNLKEYRVKSGLSQQELANKLKISRISVSRYENGKRRIHTDTFGKLCDILDIPSQQRMELIKEFGKIKEE
ncbi:helix-turn-helix transcriptional regulator [Erysipelotrichaceae bacterium OttesenSCG-928-M19]|nr:helix-turn-helix transcriptional regulator [Erysipelotrichaceae bacterium OttesenSCG-928-M19]